MARRRKIGLHEQLAAALTALGDLAYRDAQQMTARQVISLFQLDHYPVCVADGGTDHHSNLVWRLRAEHQAKTRKIDQPAIAKTTRLSKAHEEFRRILLARAPGEPRQKRGSIPSRPWKTKKKT